MSWREASDDWAEEHNRDIRPLPPEGNRQPQTDRITEPYHGYSIEGDGSTISLYGPDGKLIGSLDGFTSSWGPTEGQALWEAAEWLLMMPDEIDDDYFKDHSPTHLAWLKSHLGPSGFGHSIEYDDIKMGFAEAAAAMGSFEAAEYAGIESPEEAVTCPKCHVGELQQAGHQMYCPSCGQHSPPPSMTQMQEGYIPDVPDTLPWGEDGNDYYRNASWREVTAEESQGYTNWQTRYVSELMDNNDERVARYVRKLVGGGGTPEQLRDYLIKKVVGPHNQQQIADAQAWNEIPEHDRLDYNYEDFKDKVGPEVAEQWGSPDVGDYTPDTIDPELVNWWEIHQDLLDELNENDTYEREQARLKDTGLTFATPGQSDETNYMVDAWMKFHGVLTEDQKVEIPGQDFQPYARYWQRMQVPVEFYRHDPGEETPEQYAEWEQQGVAEPKIGAFGWTTLHDIQNGRANEWQVNEMRAALASQGHTEVDIERIMRQTHSWNEDEQRYLKIKPDAPKPQPNLDEGSSGLTLPEDWRTSAWKVSAWRDVRQDDVPDRERRVFIKRGPDAGKQGYPTGGTQMGQEQWFIRLMEDEDASPEAWESWGGVIPVSRHNLMVEDLPDTLPWGDAEQDYYRKAKVASEHHWVFVNGVVKIGTDPMWEIARTAAEEAGLDETEAARISNMIARNMQPHGAAVAAGVLTGTHPRIWTTNADRNLVWGAVLDAMRMERTAMSLNPEAFAKYPKRATGAELASILDDAFLSLPAQAQDVYELQVVSLDKIGINGQQGFETYNQNGAWWDEASQGNGGIHPDGYHRDLEQAIKRGEDVPPLLLWVNGDRYESIDGWHRASLARSLGYTEFPAYVHDPRQ